MVIRYFSRRTGYPHKAHTVGIDAINQLPGEGEGPAALMYLDYQPALEHPNFSTVYPPGSGRRTPSGMVMNETGFSDRYLVQPRTLNWYDLAIRSASTIEAAKAREVVARKLSEGIEAEPMLSNRVDNLTRETTRGIESQYLITKQRQRRRQGGIDYAKAIKELKKRPPTEFFDTQPSEAIVTQAFSHPSMEAQIPILGAHLVREYGELTSSGDLSIHSSRFVRKAISKGFPVKTADYNPNAEQNNSIRKDEYDEYQRWVPEYAKKELDNPLKEAHTRELTDAEVKSAGTYIRSFFKKPKDAPLNDHQFTQPRLPGMSEGPMGSWY